MWCGGFLHDQVGSNNDGLLAICWGAGLCNLPGADAASHLRNRLPRPMASTRFGQIDALRYTWNLEGPGFKLSRSWVWQTKTDQVSYEGKDKSGKSGKPVKVA